MNNIYFFLKFKILKLINILYLCFFQFNETKHVINNVLLLKYIVYMYKLYYNLQIYKYLYLYKYKLSRLKKKNINSKIFLLYKKNIFDVYVKLKKKKKIKERLLLLLLNKKLKKKKKKKIHYRFLKKRINYLRRKKKYFRRKNKLVYFKKYLIEKKKKMTKIFNFYMSKKEEVTNENKGKYSTLKITDWVRFYLTRSKSDIYFLKRKKINRVYKYFQKIKTLSNIRKKKKMLSTHLDFFFKYDIVTQYKNEFSICDYNSVIYTDNRLIYIHLNSNVEFDFIKKWKSSLQLYSLTNSQIEKPQIYIKKIKNNYINWK